MALVYSKKDNNTNENISRSQQRKDFKKVQQDWEP
jgi:hypothetical protein